MRTYLIQLLQQLEKLIPPPFGSHHCIVAVPHESEDHLTVEINVKGILHYVFLEDKDFHDTSTKLAEAVMKVYSESQLLEETN